MKKRSSNLRQGGAYIYVRLFFKKLFARARVVGLFARLDGGILDTLG